MPHFPLSPAQIEQFQRDGYVALPPIAAADELAELRTIYDRLFAERAGRAEGNQFDLGGVDEEGEEAVLPQILNPKKYAPELEEAPFRAKALSIAQQLLGTDELSVGEHAILKPARYGAETPWHQDEAYWSPLLEYHSLSLWMPLQEATVENGCMQFVPQSQQQEVQPHHPIHNDPRIHGLEADEIPENEIVTCPLEAGAVTAHHCRTLHYAGPNTSDSRRRAYILVFGAPTKKRETERDFYWQRMQQTARTARHDASVMG